MGGGVMIASITVGIWHVRSRRIYQSSHGAKTGVSLISQNARKNWLHNQNSVQLLAAYLGFAILTCTCLLLLLDGPSGLA
jgi:hypothetical protein